MRVIIEDKKGFSRVFIPESFNDLFLLTRIVDRSDLVSSKTTRRIHRTDSSTRSGDKGERLPMTLTLEVKEVRFQDSEVDRRLRVKGLIRDGPADLISIGSNHTLNITKGM